MADMYTHLLHGISERRTDIINTDSVRNIGQCLTLRNGDRVDRTTRVSLTIRNVPKTLKMKLKF